MRAVLGFVAVSSQLALGVGCSAAVVDPASIDSGAEALSVVEVRAHQTVGPMGNTIDRLDASARFLTVGKDAREAALDLLGLGWAAPPSGTCVAPQAVAPSTSARVDLRDLSPVTLSVLSNTGVAADPSQTTFSLEPRAFPDVAGLVSGVVFVAPQTTPVPSFPRIDGVSFAVGGRALTGFELPELPSKVRLVGALPTTIAGVEAYSVEAGGFDLVVGTPSATDPIVVEVVRSGVVHARCGFDAAGKLRIDAVSAGGVGELGLVLRAQRRVVRDDAVLGQVDARLERVVEIRVVAR
ncbi:MAG: hypothetical protein IPJ34_39805 [Myxococcales bacterium]|nr:hypothetical protein [Myxococcales bacterium]